MSTERNQLCACGSGKLRKHCCGSGHGTAAQIPSLLAQALSILKSGHIAEAEALYRTILAINPNEPHALDTLGAICLIEMRCREAVQHSLRAAEVTAWRAGPVLYNLGMICGRLLHSETNRLRAELLEAFTLWCRMQTRCPLHDPLVSIVVASYNHAHYLPEALESVFNQTYRKLEVIVIDDGSTDGSAGLLDELRARCPFPSIMIARENRGAPATLNEGMTQARGEYINILNSDDCFAPTRIERMVSEIAARNLDWGFSKVRPFLTDTGTGNEALLARSYAKQLTASARYVLGRGSNSMAFVEVNPAISTGNLFFRRSLVQQIGGFNDFRYNHDWDFCLRAGRVAEPWYVAEELYHYRIHGHNTISENRQSAKQELHRILRKNLYENPQGSAGAVVNPLSPCVAGNRALVDGIVMGSGKAIDLLPVSVLRATAGALARKAAVQPVAVDLREPGIAVVILGAPRSGTSALSRALNLAGAVLPKNVRPPKLGDNDRGFWEAEEVIRLNDLLLQSVNATWEEPRTDVRLSDHHRAMFMRLARNMLRFEYGNAPLIVLKDPRLCLFVDPWDEALTRAGYSVRYVLMVRPPSEVADSLNAQTDMDPEKALALWKTYSQTAELSTRERSRLFVHYHHLLDDWRCELTRISQSLGVGLDISACADAVDDFLTRDLYRHRSRIEAPRSVLEDACQTHYAQWASLCRDSR